MGMARPRSLVSSLLFVVLAAAAALAGCKKEQAPGGSATEIVATTTAATGGAAGGATGAAGAAQEARALFDSTCAICHGPAGLGDGPASANLNPRPRDYSDKAWQASVTDADLHAIILQGGAAVGKSATMPGQPQLKGKPEVVDALVAIIRGFGR
jgi:mono/diheme cytochrome c family protein